jgi:transposase
MDGGRQFTRAELLDLASKAPEVLVELVLALQEQVAQLRQEVALLREQLAKHSRNSNKPPSSDGLSKPPAPKNLRGKSGRLPGGQRGHRGQTLEQVQTPDTVILHALDKCPCGLCQGVALDQEPLLGIEKRQVFDLPPVRRLEVTEHQVEIKRCPCSGQEVRAAFPAEVKAATQYGERFLGLTVYLNTQQLLPFERVSQLCEDLFKARIGLGTLSEANRRTYEALGAFEAQVADHLHAAPVVHFDESGVRVAGKLHWLHVACTGALTFYSVHPWRGSEATDADGILPGHQGWKVHDFWSPYFSSEEGGHALCNQHILRELKFLFEEHKERWAGELMDLLEEFHERSKAAAEIDERLLEECHERYQGLLKRARRKHPRRPKGQKRGKQSKECNLLERLEDYEYCILAFLSDSQVPFTNNQAERDIRMMKVKQKISGCFRTLPGARCFARIRGFFSTARKQGHNLLDSITQALRGHLFDPAPT